MKSFPLLMGLQGTVFEKIKYVINKNNGFQTLCKAAKILNGETVDIHLDPHIITNLKYAPITSVDVERSCSIFKHVLSDRRQFEN
jgi:hypothetical protein